MRKFISRPLSVHAAMFALGVMAIAPSGLSAAESAPAGSGYAARPSIVVILADDLGYGDVHCLNPKRGKIPTPHIDRLAAQGMTFTDAHSSSSVCTPTRYSLLTGRYNWRSRLQREVLNEMSNALIPAERPTVASLLTQQGYATACIGKWHLGWNWPRAGKAMDFTKPIEGGPTAVGFDYFFGVDAPGFPPYCFIENDRTVGIPSVQKEKTTGGDHRHAGRAGIALPGWKLEGMLPEITDKACQFIGSQAKAKKPFFLYFPLTSPHSPLAVNQEWEGKSGLNLYADFVMETDAMVGRVLQALEQGGVADRTLVIFTSDNGCAPYIGVNKLEAMGHFPSAQFRGYKSDTWDGGHRVPFIVRWPGLVMPGATCPQLVCQMDLLATCADITGGKIPDDAAEDSVSLLPLLKGGDQPVRETLVHHSFHGNFAIREGNWKLVLGPGSGGWSPPPAPPRPPVQLYDMSADEGEQHNLQAEHPEIVKRLTAKLEKFVADGRSTPGPKRQNDVPVDIFKKGK